MGEWDKNGRENGKSWRDWINKRFSAQCRESEFSPLSHCDSSHNQIKHRAHIFWSQQTEPDKIKERERERDRFSWIELNRAELARAASIPAAAAEAMSTAEMDHLTHTQTQIDWMKKNKSSSGTTRRTMNRNSISKTQRLPRITKWTTEDKTHSRNSSRNDKEREGEREREWAIFMYWVRLA